MYLLVNLLCHGIDFVKMKGIFGIETCTLPVCHLQAECADGSSVSPHTDSSARPSPTHSLPDHF